MDLRISWGLVRETKQEQGHKYKTKERGSWRKGFKEMRVPRSRSSSLIDLWKTMVQETHPAEIE